MRRAIATIGTLALLVAAATTATASSLPPPVPLKQVLAAVAAAPSIKSIPKNITPTIANAPNDQAPSGEYGCVVGYSATTNPACVYGDTRSSKVVALFGDSHAGMWDTALNLAALRAGWKVVLFSKTACPAVEMGIWEDSENAPYAACTTWRSWVLRQIKRIRPRMVVLTSLFYEIRTASKQPVTTAEWATGLRSMIKAVKPSTKSVVVIGDIPYLAEDDPECLAAHLSAPEACNTPASQAVDSAHDASERATAMASDARYVDVVPWLCSNVCTAIIGNMVVYHNQYHLTATYATYLSGVLGSSLFGRRSS